MMEMEYNDGDIDGAISQAQRAAEALSKFKTIHETFLEGHKPLMVDIWPHPKIVFGPSLAPSVAKYFGNEGWNCDSTGRRERSIDGVEVVVVGLPKEEWKAPLITLATHLDVFAKEHCKIGVPTIEHSPLHGTN